MIISGFWAREPSSTPGTRTTRARLSEFGNIRHSGIPAVAEDLDFNTASRARCSARFMERINIDRCYRTSRDDWVH